MTDIFSGYRLGALKLSPIVRFEDQLLDNASDALPSVMRVGAGVAYWYMGHNANLKLFFTYVKPDSNLLNAYGQLNLQAQFYVF